MAAPGHAFTISLVAEMLGEDEDLLWEVALEMEPEDGKLWIHDTGEQDTVAFTKWGIENLRELIVIHKSFQKPPRP